MVDRKGHEEEEEEEEEDEEEEGGGGHTLARLFRQAICRNGVEGNRGRVNDLEGQGRV